MVSKLHYFWMWEKNEFLSFTYPCPFIDNEKLFLLILMYARVAELTKIKSSSYQQNI